MWSQSNTKGSLIETHKIDTSIKLMDSPSLSLGQCEGQVKVQWSVKGQVTQNLKSFLKRAWHMAESKLVQLFEYLGPNSGIVIRIRSIFNSKEYSVFSTIRDNTFLSIFLKHSLSLGLAMASLAPHMPPIMGAVWAGWSLITWTWKFEEYYSHYSNSKLWIVLFGIHIWSFFQKWI